MLRNWTLDRYLGFVLGMWTAFCLAAIVDKGFEGRMDLVWGWTFNLAVGLAFAFFVPSPSRAPRY